LIWLRYGTQPIWEVWTRDAQVNPPNGLKWYSRRIRYLRRGGWVVKNYVFLQSANIDPTIDPTIEPVEMVALRRIWRIDLLKEPGVRLDRAFARVQRQAQPEPQPGDTIRDRYGEFKCLACAEGWVMARRKGCAPAVFPMDIWHAYRDPASGSVEHDNAALPGWEIPPGQTDPPLCAGQPGGA
jgi:hypothetical protein